MPTHKNVAGLPGFYVRGGRRTRYGATQHISVVLTACVTVSRGQVPVANWHTAADRGRCEMMWLIAASKTEVLESGLFYA